MEQAPKIAHGQIGLLRSSELDAENNLAEAFGVVINTHYHGAFFHDCCEMIEFELGFQDALNSSSSFFRLFLVRHD